MERCHSDGLRCVAQSNRCFSHTENTQRCDHTTPCDERFTYFGHTPMHADCDGNVIQDGITMEEGSASTVDVCLDVSEDGYTIVAGGGSWDSEISWTLLDDLGNPHLIGGAGTFTTCPPTTCSDNDWDLHLGASWGDGWNGATISVSGA